MIKIDYLIELSNNACRSLMRDYMEMERSIIQIDNFAQKSLDRIKQNIEKKIVKNYSYVDSQEDDHILIVPIDNMQIFKMRMEYFAFLAIYQIKNHQDVAEAYSVVIHFPILGKMYFAQKGKGAYAEDFGCPKRKISVSRENSGFFISDEKKFLSDKKNFMSFKSDLYSGTMVASGRVDYFISAKLNPIVLKGLSLLVSEAKGEVIKSNNSITLKNNGSH
jgi:fructose-1,6-bisphosphatase/inositol monophosphatase family enzyme